MGSAVITVQDESVWDSETDIRYSPTVRQ